MAVFPLIADPQRYVACPWNLTTDDVARRRWHTVFSNHWPKMVAEALDTGADRAALDRAGETFRAFLDRVEDGTHGYERLTILDMCIMREKVLRDEGVGDPYRLAKQRENDRALAVLPDLLKQLDGAPPQTVLEGVFAGNIYDLGAVETADLFDGGATVEFADIRAKLKPRPWLHDCLDAWTQRIETGYRSAVLFVDNAGPDICLGMIPFARDLLRRGTRVILAANNTPTLNDITVDELNDLLDRIAAFDETIRAARGDGRLRVMSSGNGYPLIDLMQVDDDFAAAVEAENPDLLVLEGMGRALESNFDAAFTCDTLKLAMIKDGVVAERLGGSLYDLVMRFECATK